MELETNKDAGVRLELYAKLINEILKKKESEKASKETK